MLVLYLNLCANRLALPDDTHKGAAQTAIRPNSNDDANRHLLDNSNKQQGEVAAGAWRREAVPVCAGGCAFKLNKSYEPY